ncbi:ATP-binding cassette sub-family A member 3 isoform X4 [Cryptotermes secundus]|uniref:ATP-binding cassette sub-family A member 3 isoform X4 n=1 Tax=Cryptotermes secundus TaxID=105785 RepID=UPI000CD7B42F|nr:ATP-binding cassette sub-family A member 3 isoform X4 [Cryptotermes secundus]
MRSPMTKMAVGWNKFTLLMWKNWTLQRRHPIQTAVEILAPVLLASLLVLIRSLVAPENFGTVTTYEPFSVDHTNGTIFSETTIQKIFMPFIKASPYAYRQKDRPTRPKFNIGMGLERWIFSPEWFIAWSPESENLTSIMDNVMIKLSAATENVTFISKPYRNQEEMDEALTSHSTNIMGYVLAGIAFDDSDPFPDNIQMKIRFPGELRFRGNESDWRTNVLFPLYQVPGPRSKLFNEGGLPGYWYEGFLLLQHVISSEITKFLNNITLPQIMLQRFPYPPYTHDDMLEALKRNVPLLMMVSFVYTCINTVKVITVEKERQLKEAMKIMGLPNWLHWTAWFIKTFMFVMISVILIVIMMKVPWYPGSDLTVFSYSDPILLLIYFIFYMIASICFCFMISVLFSKANTASLMAAILWFFSYVPFMFMSEQYENLHLPSKILACLLSNSAMAFGFQLFLMYEGAGVGMQWHNIWTPVTADDDLVLGHVMIMLLVDALIYLLLTLYIEAVAPGEYGVPKPWYFPVQLSYWCENSDYNPYFETVGQKTNVNSPDVYEAEPRNLPAGIQIKHLRKKYGSKEAVKDLTLNMYEGHITVLLGHNGAGKTTTMSMLTGMITPTSGTALVGGFDVRTDIHKVRESLGLCPQHNVLFEDLTVREHLYFFGKMKGLSGHALKAEIKKYISLLELEPKEHTESSKLSGGMQRKLAAGVALCGGSKIVMFDEPTSGLDPAARRALWDLLQTEKHGRTTLLTTHFMDEADLLGDRIAIMAGGELQCCGSSFFLKKKYGAGYRLIIVKGPDCNVDSVTSLLNEFIPKISVDQNIGSELSYLLSENQSSVFEAMLSKLEENKKKLGLLSYGVSLTTMEEVFMKVGKDTEISAPAEHQQTNGIDNVVHSSTFEVDDSSILPSGNKCFATCINHLYMSPRNASRFIVTMPHYPLLKGSELLINQLIAMFMKKALYVWRTWYITLIQILMPSLFLILTIVIVKTWQTIPDLPPLKMDLKAYGKIFTPIEVKNEHLRNVSLIYKDLTGGIVLNETTKMSDYILRQSKIDLREVRQNYIMGATFCGNETAPTIIGWFNNLPYHSIPLAVQTIYNTILRYYTYNKTINVVNHPLPYTEDTVISFQSWASNNMGFQVSFSLGFSMAFVSAFFIIFYVKERVSKAKHLQIVSGVEVLTFWLSSIVWDLFFFLLPVVGVIITFAAFREDGFRTGAELGRIFVVMICFSWSLLPATYLLSFIFSIPLTGFTRMTMINVVTGIALFMTVNILKLPSLELQDVAEILDWIFLFFPHYSLCSCVHGLYTNYAYNKACSAALLFPGLCLRPNICCKNNCPENGCLQRTDDYFDWQAPGIGRNIAFFILDGIFILIILLMMEFRLFERFAYFIQKSDVKIGTDNDGYEEELDSDVSAEKLKLLTTETSLLLNEYELVLKNVTKYYGKFLAVNKLCLGVKKGECFGLLGVNGAGKTTTFKMMTGDEKISAGEGYVSHLSLKSNMKEVHQLIGYCPQFDALLEDLTGYETLTMFSLLRGLPSAKIHYVINYLADELLFKKHLNKKVKEYSGGNKRKLSTAIALIGDPPVIYLDEPTTGMDPAAKRHLWNVICKIRDSGRCIILTSHSMEECEALCTRLAIMVNGCFKCLGSTQHLKNKFAKGYTLIVKTKKTPNLLANGSTTSNYSVPSKGIDSYDLQPVRQFVAESFPGAMQMEEYQGLLTYCITNPTLTWARMFGMMEKAKHQLNIEDYSLGQTSLEQVFLTFTKKQREE